MNSPQFEYNSATRGHYSYNAAIWTKRKTRRKNLVRLLEVYFPVLVRVDSCAKILRRDKHLPRVVTEKCGACWLFRSPLGQRNPKPTLHAGHVFSASEKQSRFVVEIALEILATI